MSQLAGILEHRAQEHSPVTPRGQNTSWLFIFIYLSIFAYICILKPTKAKQAQLPVSGELDMAKGSVVKNH